MAEIQVDELRNADARRIQQLQHCLIPVAFEIRQLRLLQQQLDLLARQDLGELLFRLLDLDVPSRILLALPCQGGVLIEIFDGRQAPLDAGGGFPVARHPVGIRHDLVVGDGQQLLLQDALDILAVLPHIPHIRRDGILRRVLCMDQIRLKGGEQFSHSVTLKQ